MLDPQLSSEEIKSREVVLGLRVGLLLLQFPQRRSYGHCLSDSVLHSSWDGNCVAGTVVAAQCRTDTEHFLVPAAVHGSLGLPGWRLSRG